MGRRAVQDGLAEAIASLFEAVDSADGEEAVACAAVDMLERMGFQAPSVGLVREIDGRLLLETVAAGGDRSTFARGATQAVDWDSDAGRVMDSGAPLYLTNYVTSEAERAEGVARWREGLGIAGHAVVPLRISGLSIGVLSFEWLERAPETRDRAALEAYASVLALALRIAGEDLGNAAAAPADTGAPETAAASLQLAKVTAHEVTSDGALIPPTAGAGMGLEPAARLHLACTPANDRHAAFVEAACGPSGAVVLAAGALHANEGASGLVSSAAAVARAAAANATDAARALGMLAGWLNGQAPAGLALSAAFAVFVPEKKALAVSTAGTCAMLLHDPDGRFGMVPPESPPFGGASPPRLETHVRVLLPGDQAVLMVGHVAELGHGAKAAAARDLLHSLQDRNADSVTRELLRTVAPSGAPGAVVLLEVADFAEESQEAL